jgi:hypothetical protein
VLYNNHIKGKFSKNLIDNIISFHNILHEIICRNETKIIKNTNNLFKWQVLMHLDEILCKINVVELSSIFSLSFGSRDEMAEDDPFVTFSW